MLKGQLYNIKKINKQNNTVEAIIELNDQHEIFQGHFPDQPILPGVCILLMVREILETALNKKLFLSKADEIRFIEMIDPNKNNEIKFDIQIKQTDAQQINSNAKILNNKNVVCGKVKASYKII